MLRSSILFVSFLLVSCSPGDRPDAESELDSRISRIENGLISGLQIKGRPQEYFNLDERLKELGIPGLSVAFSSNGEVEWARAYGMADKSENKSMTTGSYLLAGSISKPVAAVRSLQLVEDEVFALDDDVNNYLTSWQVPNNEFTTTEKVTLRRILSHTAGLTVWGFPGYDKGDEIPSVVDVLDGKGNTDPVRVFRQPGEAWQYSGGGYTIMQLAIEDTEDIDFAQSMKENVLDRMRMPGSTYENPLPVALHGIAATGYRANGDEVEGKWPIYPEMAAAGLWTTPSELIQYGIEIQRILQSGQDGILSYKTVSEMLDAESDTHDNVISVSGACAISTAVNAALSDGITLKDVMDAAIKGADQGYYYAEQHGAMMMAGPSVARRIELAVQIGQKHASWETAVSELADIIGTGIHASEAVPAVFGILACCGNDPEKAILAAVNIGNDTDTIATMVGSIVGALHGIEALPSNYLPVLNKANKFKLEDLATRVLQLHNLDNLTNNFIPKIMLQ